MENRLAIGDFARATHMSVKTLRCYHRVGLLEPADVDADTGYRRYTTKQIPAAQIIRRFRNLDMPVEEVRQVLAAPDIETRNELIAAHLNRLEEGLTRTHDAVSSLRDLLAARRRPSWPTSAACAWMPPRPPRSASRWTSRTRGPGTRARSASCTRRSTART